MADTSDRYIFVCLEAQKEKAPRKSTTHVPQMVAGKVAKRPASHSGSSKLNAELVFPEHLEGCGDGVFKCRITRKKGKGKHTLVEVREVISINRRAPL